MPQCFATWASLFSQTGWGVCALHANLTIKCGCKSLKHACILLINVAKNIITLSVPSRPTLSKEAAMFSVEFLWAALSTTNPDKTSNCFHQLNRNGFCFSCSGQQNIYATEHTEQLWIIISSYDQKHYSCHVNCSDLCKIVQILLPVFYFCLDIFNVPACRVTLQAQSNEYKNLAVFKCCPCITNTPPCTPLCIYFYQI